MEITNFDLLLNIIGLYICLILMYQIIQERIEESEVRIIENLGGKSPETIKAIQKLSTLSPKNTDPHLWNEIKETLNTLDLQIENAGKLRHHKT